MGPPTNASGATWPAVNPRVAPEKRPSVSSATVCAEIRMSADCRRHLQHLAHARAALRAFVANDQHVAGLDLAGLHGGKTFLFAIEDARRTAMLHTVGGGNLHHAALGREIAFQNHQPACRLDRLVEGMNHDLAGSLLCQRRFFGECLAADGKRRPIGMPASMSRFASSRDPPAAW